MLCSRVFFLIFELSHPIETNYPTVQMTDWMPMQHLLQLFVVCVVFWVLSFTSYWQWTASDQSNQQQLLMEIAVCCLSLGDFVMKMSVTSSKTAICSTMKLKTLWSDISAGKSDEVFFFYLYIFQLQLENLPTIFG